MPQIMGILNCTPDSFYDGGKYPDTESLVSRGLQMAEEGADWIDIGGESTRPGAKPVSTEEQLERILPVIQGLRKKTGFRVSVDTTRSQVASAALDHGAEMVNDVSGLTSDTAMAGLIARHGVYVIIMHSRGNPETMQTLTQYDDVIGDVKNELRARTESAIACGMTPQKILVDPGFGFAKDYSQNMALLKNLGSFKELGFPVVAGLSRKSFLGHMVNRPDPSDRLIPSLGAAFYAAIQGVDMIRVHDVKETREMLTVLKCLRA